MHLRRTNLKLIGTIQFIDKKREHTTDHYLPELAFKSQFECDSGIVVRNGRSLPNHLLIPLEPIMYRTIAHTTMTYYRNINCLTVSRCARCPHPLQ